MQRVQPDQLDLLLRGDVQKLGTGDKAAALLRVDPEEMPFDRQRPRGVPQPEERLLPFNVRLAQDNPPLLPLKLDTDPSDGEVQHIGRKPDLAALENRR